MFRYVCFEVLYDGERRSLAENCRVAGHAVRRFLMWRRVRTGAVTVADVGEAQLKPRLINARIVCGQSIRLHTHPHPHPPMKRGAEKQLTQDNVDDDEIEVAYLSSGGVLELT